MTVTATTNRVSFAGNGVTTAFAFTFPITAKADLLVMTQSSGGTEATLALNTDYTVSAAPWTSGGTVTATTAPASGVTLHIIGNTPNTQGVTLQDGGPLPAATLNGALDRLTMIVRRAFDKLSRVPILRDTDSWGTGQIDLGGNRFTNSANGVAATDLATVAQLATAGATGPAAWLPPVAWVAGLACVVGPPATTVVYQGETYVCTTAHTAGGAFDASKWIKVAQKGAAGAGTGDMLAANNLSEVNPATARTNLGLAIGTNVQAFDTGLAELAAITAATGDIIVGDGADSWAKVAVGTNGQVLTSNGTTAVWATPASSTGAVGPSGFRLSLLTGTSVITTTTTGIGTVFLTQHVGQYCPLYDGSIMAMVDLGGQLSNVLANSATNKAGPAAAANNSNYDFFVWNDSGTYRLTRGPLWTSDTGRGTGAGTTELIKVQGVLLNANSITNGPAAQRGTYVGTMRTNGSATVDYQFGALATGGTAGIVGVWNMFNRVNVSMFVQDDTNSWNYTIATIRAANASNTMRVSFISGLAEDGISARYKVAASNNPASTMTAGIGYDSTSAFAAGSSPDRLSTNTTILHMNSFLEKSSDLGFHYVQACEHSVASGTTTWYGDNAAPTLLQSGLYFNFRA